MGISKRLETEKAWYVLHTYSGYEDKIKKNLESRMTSMGMEDNIFEILVPQHAVYEEDKEGDLVEAQKKIFPGYVLVEMIMSDEAWFVVRNTPGVTGFVGSHGAGSKPSPLLPEEIERIFKSMGMKPRKIDIDVEVGETIRIISGAFAGMEATVAAVDEDRGLIDATVEMFGRETNAELEFSQIATLEH
ncbi:transcription termination/antitermination protein NusG [Allofustis seminis]|uniref:transcription termination/antitermination protein NusG n=1 Tax=Allofustis seminis TaxID=166939 RepID=UPI00037AAC00|nr:transcription termination/antitermination protein NusG [Allofustis seminis]